mmetsp:Transcript_108061/g.345099  ORF Transcript_108061/g.345099 Transcript_108061/m.345099 type:complete len:255 (-) Transcript_108061:601-1365(-)
MCRNKSYSMLCHRKQMNSGSFTVPPPWATGVDCPSRSREHLRRGGYFCSPSISEAITAKCSWTRDLPVYHHHGDELLPLGLSSPVRGRNRLQSMISTGTCRLSATSTRCSHAMENLEIQAATLSAVGWLMIYSSGSVAPSRCIKIPWKICIAQCAVRAALACMRNGACQPPATATTFRHPTDSQPSGRSSGSTQQNRCARHTRRSAQEAWFPGSACLASAPRPSSRTAVRTQTMPLKKLPRQSSTRRPRKLVGK